MSTQVSVSPRTLLSRRMESRLAQWPHRQPLIHKLGPNVQMFSITKRMQSILTQRECRVILCSSLEGKHVLIGLNQIDVIIQGTQIEQIQSPIQDAFKRLHATSGPFSHSYACPLLYFCPFFNSLLLPPFLSCVTL